MVTIPTVTVEVDFTSDVLAATPSWTDVTSYVRAWSCTRGRNHELQRIDAGTATLTLDNPDGRFTPGNAAGTYYPNVVPRRRLRISAVWSAVTYRLFTGYIQSWKLIPGGWPDKWSQVEVAATDAFLILSGIPLESPYAQVVLADGPSAYLPLTEPQGATSAGNRIPLGSATAPLVQSKNGPAGSEFGGDTILPYGDPGSSLNLNPASTASRAEIIDCSQQFDSFPFYQQFWTFECWTLVSQTPGGTQYFLRHQYRTGTGINGFAVSLHTDGTVNVTSGTEVDVITSTSIVDSQPHHLVLVYTGTDGTHGSVQLWLDGAQVGSTYTLTANPFPFGEQANSVNTACCVGGVQFGSHEQNGGLRGLLGHVAFWDDALNSTQIGNHHAAGFTGSPENENTRIGTILDYAQWPAADRDLDAGLADTLQPRDWAQGSNVQNLTVDAAAAAGGVLFMSGAGKITYQNRAVRYNAAVAATFRSSTSTDAEVDGFTAAADDAEIRNTLDVSRAGQGVTRVIDTDSVARYGAIADSVDLAVTTDDEVISAANWQLYVYADPPPRMPTVTWQASTNPTGLFPLLLPRELGDRIRLDDLPATVPDGPLDAFVEQITHGSGATANEWVSTFQLSPATRYDVSVWGTGEWGGGGSPQLIWAY